MTPPTYQLRVPKGNPGWKFGHWSCLFLQAPGGLLIVPGLSLGTSYTHRRKKHRSRKNNSEKVDNLFGTST